MLYRREELGLHLVIVKLAVKGFSDSVASSTIEKETILSDRYLKLPYGGYGGERVKTFYVIITKKKILYSIFFLLHNSAVYLVTLKQKQLLYFFRWASTFCKSFWKEILQLGQHLLARKLH